MLILPIHIRGNVIAIADDAAPGRVCVALARPRAARRADGSSRVRFRALGGNGLPDPLNPPAGGYAGHRHAADAGRLIAAGLAPQETSPMPWLQARLRLEGPQLRSRGGRNFQRDGNGRGRRGRSRPSRHRDSGAASLPRDSVAAAGHVERRRPGASSTGGSGGYGGRERSPPPGFLRPARPARHCHAIGHGCERPHRDRGADNPALEQALRDWALDELTRRFSRGESVSIRAAVLKSCDGPSGWRRLSTR